MQGLRCDILIYLSNLGFKPLEIYQNLTKNMNTFLVNIKISLYWWEI